MSSKKLGAEHVARLVAWVLVFICSAPLLVALYLLFSHTVEWLKFGNWPYYTTAQMFSDGGIVEPTSNWIGFQIIINYIMSFPAAGVLVVMSLLLGLTLGKFAESIYEFN